VTPGASESHGWLLRPLAAADLAAVLALNACHQPAVQLLDAATLRGLLEFPGHHLVAADANGEVRGYLLAIASAADYHDTEISELRRRGSEPFLYICQVVVASAWRGAGIGRAFYTAAAEAARRQGVFQLCSDVNLEPPNPDSLAFHRRLGFVEIGRGTASNGFAIAFLQRRLSRSGKALGAVHPA
jgi:predicted GNAT superfamily acetyltransferase